MTFCMGSLILTSLQVAPLSTFVSRMVVWCPTFQTTTMKPRNYSLSTCIIIALQCISSASAFVSRPSSLAGVPLAVQPSTQNVLCRRLSTSSESSLAVTGDASATGSSSDPVTAITVALTRELGKNTKLEGALTSHPGLRMMGLHLNVVELPCIEHAEGDDLPKLVDILSSDSINNYHYVVITSPEAARVLASAIDESDIEDMQKFNDVIKVAAVGKATGKTLEKLGIFVDFVPSQATGEILAAELPHIDRAECTKVLYPASSKARNDIQDGLEARTSDADDAATFEFTRLNTYDTVPATFTASQMSQVDDIEIACFGSPSAVSSWLQNMDVKYNLQDVDDEAKKKLGAKGNGNVLTACIGTTSARAVLESGRWNAMDIYYPKENPGVDSWAESIVQACGDVLEKKFWS